MHRLLGAVTVVAAFVIPLFAAGCALGQTHREMLYPVVRVGISGNPYAGSGTVVWSQGDPVVTYVLTAHHVVDRAIRMSQPVRLYWPGYDGSDRVGVNERIADVVAYSPERDIALLRSRDTSAPMPHVAVLQGEDDPLEVFEQVIAVGSPLGLWPMPTTGMLAALRAEGPSIPDRVNYLLISAPIIYGNSGGAVFHWDQVDGRWEMIGMPIGILSAPAGPFAVPVSHLGVAVPVEEIRAFLADHCLAWIAGGAECETPA